MASYGDGTLYGSGARYDEPPNRRTKMSKLKRDLKKDSIPDKTTLIEGSRRMSFRELDASTNRFARAVARHGAGSGAVVAFFGKNSTPFFEVLFGAGRRVARCCRSIGGLPPPS